jgi:hypothetical protein
MTKRMRMMPVMATIHFLPIGEEKSGRQQEEVFLEEAGPLMSIAYRRGRAKKQHRRMRGRWREGDRNQAAR